MQSSFNATRGRVVTAIESRRPFLFARNFGSGILSTRSASRWERLSSVGSSFRCLTKDLDAYEVSALVNSLASDSPECVRPVE
jgi:hypothetical protein